jgi:hypothetical protein
MNLREVSVCPRDAIPAGRVNEGRVLVAGLVHGLCEIATEGSPSIEAGGVGEGFDPDASASLETEGYTGAPEAQGQLRREGEGRASVAIAL